MYGRTELRRALNYLRHGDVLIVTRIDRLARSIGHLQDIVDELRKKGAKIKATEQPIDTSTSAGKCFLDMLGVFAEFENNLRREARKRPRTTAPLKPMRPRTKLTSAQRRE